MKLKTESRLKLKREWRHEVADDGPASFEEGFRIIIPQSLPQQTKKQQTNQTPFIPFNHTFSSSYLLYNPLHLQRKNLSVFSYTQIYI